MKFLIIFFLISLSLFGMVPNSIPIQGVLTNIDDTPINGNINLTLSLYNSQTSTNELWKEERDDFAVKNGYISVYLGEITELTPSVVSNADELWLEISFNNEVMPRVRLASVPFAIETINAQKAKQIGDITESQITNIFNSGCADGFYIKGYNNDGNSICAEDKTGSINNNLNYNAGDGIVIDENNNISVSKNLYSAENGIILKNNIISVDTAKVANILHNHSQRYYEKTNNAQNNNLVKFIGNPSSGYKLENSNILEESGVITISNLNVTNKITSNNNVMDIDDLGVKIITPNINNDIDINTNSIDSNGDITITGEITSTRNITSTGSSSKITSNGIITPNEVTVKKLYFSGDVQKVISTIKVITSDEATTTTINNNSSSDTYYISNNGALTTNSSTNSLTANNSVCFLSMDDLASYGSNTSNCDVYFDSHDNWVIHVSNKGNITTKCSANCLIWN